MIIYHHVEGEEGSRMPPAKWSEIKEANPDTSSFGDLGKLVGAAWKELNDSEKVKVGWRWRNKDKPVRRNS